MTSETELSHMTSYAVIADGALRMERLLLNKLMGGRGSIRLTRPEAERMVAALGEIAAIETERDEDFSRALEKS